MPVTYPLNDIEYSAEDVAIYNATRTSGVYAGEDFSLGTVSGLVVNIHPGLAWMRLSRWRGIAHAQDVPTGVRLGLADATRPRIDAIALRWNANDNAADIVVVGGIPATNPVPPTPQRSEALYDLHLYHVLREPGEAGLSPAVITDVRMDDRYCGLMADSVTKVDTGSISAQLYDLIEKTRQALVDAGTGVVPDGSVTPAKLSKSYLETTSSGAVSPKIILQEGVHYGTSYPANPVKGQLFFLKK